MSHTMSFFRVGISRINSFPRDKLFTGIIPSSDRNFTLAAVDANTFPMPSMSQSKGFGDKEVI